MAYTQEDLDLIDTHVAQGERNVQQQRQIVSGLGENGYPTGEALELLTALEDTLHQLQQRRLRIRNAVWPQHAIQRSTGRARILDRAG